MVAMTDTLTVTGLVATTPRHLITAEGLAVTSFRLASNLRKFDRHKNSWVDAGTNWYTVSTYRQLALNLVTSLNKGDRVLVTGKLRIREWGDGDRTGLNIDLDADALGHDLSWGTATFVRSIHSTVREADAPSTPAENDFPSEESGSVATEAAVVPAENAEGTASSVEHDADVAVPF